MVAVLRRKIRNCKSCKFFMLDEARSYSDTHDYYYKCLIDEQNFDHDRPEETVCDQHKCKNEK